jgi:putative ABC transport system substrate-binding protein
MRRREFISLVGGTTAVWPLAARAQQPDRMRRIGALILYSENDQQSQRTVVAFQQGMEKLGWTVGRNLAIDYHWGIRDPERARVATAELLRLAPDLILARSVSAVRAAQQATRTIPIVFTAVSEPINPGFVASLAHPRGNTSCRGAAPDECVAWSDTNGPR